MKINLGQLRSHLKNTLAPCYLISGDEHLLAAEAQDAIRAAAHERGFSSRELHVATTGFDWDLLRQSGANLSLFAERQIVELRLPTGKPGRAGGEAIVELAGRTGPDLLLMVCAPKLERGGTSSKWARTLDERGVIVPVWPVGPRELPGWIDGRMRQAGLEPDRAAVAIIADRVEGNLLAASQEVEKLRLLLGKGPVNGDDVRAAVANSSRYNVFQLVDSALAGDAPRALKMLSGLCAEGVLPVVVVWSLTRELRMLAGLADAISYGSNLAAAMQKAGVWRNRQALVRSCVGRHGPGEFRQLLKVASLADRASKGQLRRDPWQLITDLVLGIAAGGRMAA